MFFKKRVHTEEALVRFISARAFLVVMMICFFGFGMLGSVQAGSTIRLSDSLGAADPADFMTADLPDGAVVDITIDEAAPQIGRASCRVRV